MLRASFAFLAQGLGPVVAARNASARKMLNTCACTWTCKHTHTLTYTHMHTHTHTYTGEAVMMGWEVRD